ncbi:hypothetical protein FA95DRAFT_595614 [Auriscalpium vulgare]|uniref:Uncharacterized protein n=1 Tax=Auriscalpium vulgare TaxID=40419 RepID=A0ACB8S1X2_9AGAM|nr:hypothetical protein FA95DRAFT_595614 [Auriscalpium vulgare]
MTSNNSADPSRTGGPEDPLLPIAATGWGCTPSPNGPLRLTRSPLFWATYALVALHMFNLPNGTEALRAHENWVLSELFCAALVLAALTNSARRRWAKHPGAWLPAVVGVELLGLQVVMGGTALGMLHYPPPWPSDLRKLILPMLPWVLTMVEKIYFSTWLWNQPGPVLKLIYAPSALLMDVARTGKARFLRL